jgi:hypothetical protein
LNVGNVCAACNERGPAVKHTIPDGTRGVVSGVNGTKKLTCEFFAERRRKFFADCGHAGLSPWLALEDKHRNYHERPPSRMESL